MPKTTEVDHLHRLVFECVHCGRVQELVMHDGYKIEIGTVLQSYAGGGTWGQCVFCKRPGLRAVTEPPKKTKGPEGWKQESSKTENK